MKIIKFAFFCLLLFSVTVFAQETDEQIKSEVLAKYSTRDYVFTPLPDRGYNYFKVAKDTYFVHNDFDNMVFFVTKKGVVVVDPKPALSQTVIEVIKEVTDKPITHVVYSHHHRDHSQGAYLFPESAELIAHKKVAEFMAIANDPMRPAPDVTWTDTFTLTTGGFTLEMKDLGRNWHSQQDVIMYAPKQKILIAIDMFHPDAAPWIHFGESSDPMFAFGLPDLLMNTYDFDFVVVGHEKIIGTKAHMEKYNALLVDMKNILIEVVKSPVYQVLGEQTDKRFAEFEVHYKYKAGITSAMNLCAQKLIESDWSKKLRNIELNAAENFQTMFMHIIVLDP
ncbi:glyoxylase-like metal-dependent hydrolase (beta-lactamase superfamily II) [Maribacter spongiicola]|uniref:Glyoxylase-like metal-dependent hydrolase (Beta-lactamase superfamily II) n=1 Tax=Maribacter spongiicola TaxID=1206753 RepID=A0A4R7K2W5_9FLAO|nr:MBL fold metallo-hydrolase [Maribacter spongiicola]TDT45212.1 glyoxylase-like metal-dependent hydrolase (beta-lactamase superfamily II) [Maribacter spongiicola]